MRERRSSDQPQMWPISMEGSKVWHDYWCYHVLRDRSQARLRQKQLLTPNQWSEVEDPCGWIKERLEEAEEEDDPIRRPTLSTNLDSWDLSDPQPPRRQHTLAGPRSLTHIQHIQQRLAWRGGSNPVSALGRKAPILSKNHFKTAFIWSGRTDSFYSKQQILDL